MDTIFCLNSPETAFAKQFHGSAGRSLHQRAYQASVQKWYHNSAAVQVGSHENDREGYEIPLQGQKCKFSYQRRSQSKETC